jgi:hypothetical protein
MDGSSLKARLTHGRSRRPRERRRQKDGGRVESSVRPLDLSALQVTNISFTWYITSS